MYLCPCPLHSQPRLCAVLRLPMAVENAAKAMCAQVLQLAEGKSPSTISATALYLASRLHATDKRSVDEIAAVSGCTVDTIKRCFRDVYPHRATIVPRDYSTAEAIDNLSML